MVNGKSVLLVSIGIILSGSFKVHSMNSENLYVNQPITTYEIRLRGIKNRLEEVERKLVEVEKLKEDYEKRERAEEARRRVEEEARRRAALTKEKPLGLYSYVSEKKTTKK